MTLRESEPEDREINLQLARLAASRQDVTEALRFYHNALYAPWPNEHGWRAAGRETRARAIPPSATNKPGGRSLNCWPSPPTCRTSSRFISKWRSCSPTPATSRTPSTNSSAPFVRIPATARRSPAQDWRRSGVGDYAGARSYPATPAARR